MDHSGFRSAKVFQIICIISVLFISACGGGNGASDDGVDNPQPGSFPATSNVFTNDTYDDTEVSVDADGISIIRTKLSILFKPTATVAEVNGLLARINATITASIAGARSVSIRIPDPGTLTALETIITDIESEAFVEAAIKSTVEEPTALPDNVTEESTNDYAIIDNHLAVRGTAAWNAKKAITSAPNIIIMDWFGAGSSQLSSFLDVNLSGTVHTGAANPEDHGYHVAGIATGSFGGGTSVSSLVTGMMPDRSNLYIIDRSNNLSGNDAEVQALQLAATIGGTVVMNTSLGIRCRESTTASFTTCHDKQVAMKRGIMWADLVRSAGMESQLFHAKSAGNRRAAPNDQRDTETNHGFATAATMTDMVTDDGTAVPVLTNAMVVERLSGNGSHPAKVKCLHDSSFVGGHISAIGSSVTSLYRNSAGLMSGTSMAAPQVAGLAAYMLSIDPSLSPQKIKEILLKTSEPVPGDSGCSDWPTPAPSIDAYAAILAVDKSSALSGNRSNAPVRNAILDIAGSNPTELGENDQFDENDLKYFIEQIETGSEEIRLNNAKVKYSRADLNGDGYNGGGSDSGGDDYKKKFDLDINSPPDFTSVKQIIEDREVDFDENALTDNDILCYYAYSNLYTGDTDQRKDLMSGRCLSGIVAVYFSHVNNIDYHGSSCNEVPVDDTEELRETLNLLDSFETFINRPESHYWHAGDFDIEQSIYDAVKTSGFLLPGGNCVDRDFYGHSELDSLIGHSDTGSKINIDITATAGSECQDVTDDPVWECSTAVAITNLFAHYDYEIKAATTLKLVLNLECTGPNLSPSGYPDPTNPLLFPPIDVMVSLVRIDSNGEGVMQHQDFAKLFVPQNHYCSDGSPVLVEHLIEFDAPENEGDTDQATILITVNAGATGNVGNISELTDPPIPVPQPGELGRQTNQTTMTGYVEVVPAN